MKKKTIKIIVTVLMLLLIIIGALFYDQLIVRPETIGGVRFSCSHYD